MTRRDGIKCPRPRLLLLSSRHNSPCAIPTLLHQGLRCMRLSAKLLLALSLYAFFTAEASACACGCGVFSVGTSAMLPSGAGGTASLEYDYLNQTQNWHGTSSAPAADNADKNVRSDFYTASLQYMFNRSWGASIAIPYTDRLFVTTQDDGSIAGFHHDSLGDIRLMGMYTGFSDDMSTGILFGLKLATGDYKDTHIDRDTSIGTGTTNLLLGAYHQANLDAENLWTGFVQAHWERAFAAMPATGPATNSTPRWASTTAAGP